MRFSPEVCNIQLERKWKIMGLWIGLGVFAAVLAGIGGIYLHLRKKVRGFSRNVFGTPDLIAGLKAVDTVHLQSPRSLNGCDDLLLPRILKDFPDFDPNLAKTYAREYLMGKLAGKKDLVVHRIVFARYLRSLSQKTIVMQAAVSCSENGSPQQKRYDLDYAYILSQDTQSVAANCPNCGGALGFGDTECPYCGSRVANVLGNTWKFTSLRET